MTVTFHITKRGEVAVCEATVRACPLGGEHYEDMNEAIAASMAAETEGSSLEELVGALRLHQELLDHSEKEGLLARLAASDAQLYEAALGILQTDVPEWEWTNFLSEEERYELALLEDSHYSWPKTPERVPHLWRIISQEQWEEAWTSADGILTEFFDPANAFAERISRQRLDEDLEEGLATLPEWALPVDPLAGHRSDLLENLENERASLNGLFAHWRASSEGQGKDSGNFFDLDQDLLEAAVEAYLRDLK